MRVPEFDIEKLIEWLWDKWNMGQYANSFFTYDPAGIEAGLLELWQGSVTWIDITRDEEKLINEAYSEWYGDYWADYDDEDD